jgi:hypothetical protein
LIARRNRLAHQFYLREMNEIESSLVFLYFTDAVDMDGPATEEEWHGATRRIHAAMGLPADLRQFGVHHAFVDARHLTDAPGGRDGVGPLLGRRT